jgi:hypothetical protein
MRSRSLLILLAVVVALGVFILMWERHQPSSDERAELSDLVLPALDPDDISEVRVEGGETTVRLVRSGEAWRLESPIKFAADPSRVNTLLTTLDNLAADRRLDLDEVQGSDYGLTEPAYRITLIGPDGEETVLAVGEETALGSNRAVQVAGEDRIAIVSGWFVSDLDRTVDDWRSRDVVDVFADQVASLEVLRGGDTIRAVRVGDQWRLLAPLTDLADRDHVRNVISDLNALRIEEFIDGAVDLGAMGLDAPEVQVMLIRTAGDEPVRLEFGATRTVDGATQVACRRGDFDVFWVNDVARIRLTKAPVLWRSSDVWPFDTWAVDRLEVTADGETVIVDRDTGGWTLADGGAADYAAVQERLAALAALEATGFDLVQPVTAEAGRVTLGFEAGDDGEPSDTVEMVFYRPLATDGDAMVTVSGRATVMSVPSDAVDAVLVDPAALRAPPDDDGNDEADAS